jgi:hypothetical protein
MTGSWDEAVITVCSACHLNTMPTVAAEQWPGNTILLFNNCFASHVQHLPACSTATIVPRKPTANQRLRALQQPSQQDHDKRDVQTN